MPVFKTDKLGERITRIYAFSSELMYLVEGDDRAALLDTGSGVGSLKGCVSFDLGGMTIEIYDCLGHTKGSVVMLVREERAVLLGDACNYFTFMFDAYSTTISRYEESLRKLSRELEGRLDTVYLSQGNGEGHREIIGDVIRVYEDIKGGNTDDVPFDFMGVQGLIAKATLPDGERRDGGRGNIVYNKSRV